MKNIYSYNIEKTVFLLLYLLGFILIVQFFFFKQPVISSSAIKFITFIFCILIAFKHKKLFHNETLFMFLFLLFLTINSFSFLFETVKYTTLTNTTLSFLYNYSLGIIIIPLAYILKKKCPLLRI